MPATSPRPNPSLLEVEFTQRPTVLATTTPSGTIGPTLVSWPVGWDLSFCRLLADTVVAQELVVDVERALDEGNEADARALAVELVNAAGSVTQQLSELPEWAPADEAVSALERIIDLDAQTGQQYIEYFDGSRPAALRRARALRRDVAAEIPQTNEALAGVADLGLTCPGASFQLESP